MAYYLALLLSLLSGHKAIYPCQSGIPDCYVIVYETSIVEF